ncbi:CPBP family glutamic-type intramembrane protease [Microbacterium paulum]
MGPIVAASITAAAGISLHLAAPTLAYVVGRSARVRRRVSSENVYDLLTLIGATACAFALFRLGLFPTGQILTFGTLCGLLLGVLAPLALWRSYGKTPTIRRPRPGSISLTLLALSAAGEEIIWRLTVIRLIHDGFGASSWVGIVLSIAGFAALHLGLHGARSIPYFLIFASLTVALTVFLGIGAAIGFHLAHNLIIALVQPRPRESRIRPVRSETTW